MNEKSGFIYIYNPLQAAFYISKGIKPIETGVHYKTNKTFFKFSYQESSDAYFEWCGRNRKGEK